MLKRREKAPLLLRAIRHTFLYTFVSPIWNIIKLKWVMFVAYTALQFLLLPLWRSLSPKNVSDVGKNCCVVAVFKFLENSVVCNTFRSSLYSCCCCWFFLLFFCQKECALNIATKEFLLLCFWGGHLSIMVWFERKSIFLMPKTW